MSLHHQEDEETSVQDLSRSFGEMEVDLADEDFVPLCTQLLPAQELGLPLSLTLAVASPMDRQEESG